jgi:limonene 1,2-monooxygenase
MIGLDIDKLRTYLEEDVPVLLHLLRSDDPITVDTGRYRLDEAKCQLDRFSDFDVAVASMFTASGPLLAGRYGLGLLQLSGLSPAGMEILPKHWGVMEAQAKKHGSGISREGWRIVGIMHLAETRDQAIKDLRFGLMEYFDYIQFVVKQPIPEAGSEFDERLEWAISTGYALIGTPADAISKLEELVESSGGGIGAFLHWAHEMASPISTAYSYELFARYVMPAFQGTTRRLSAARELSIKTFAELSAIQVKGKAEFVASHKEEIEQD